MLPPQIYPNAFCSILPSLFLTLKQNVYCEQIKPLRLANYSLNWLQVRLLVILPINSSPKQVPAPSVPCLKYTAIKA